jgi:hypothetical protein
LGDITIDQILKLDLSYRKARLDRAKEERINGSTTADRFAAKVITEAVAKMTSMAPDDTVDTVAAMSEPLLAWAKERFGTGDIDDFLDSDKEVEKLAAFINTHRNKEDEHDAIHGLAG